MKKAPLVLALFATLLAAPALACGDNCSLGFVHIGGSRHVHIRSRFDPAAARLAINTRDDKATMLITDDVIAVQLSDGELQHIRREFREEQNEDDNALAQAIKAVVFASVKTVLNHSAVVRVRDVRDVVYVNGRLRIVTNDRDAVFASLDVDDDDVMTTFSDSDARAFVREFRRVKGSW